MNAMIHLSSPPGLDSLVPRLLPSFVPYLQAPPQHLSHTVQAPPPRTVLCKAENRLALAAFNACVVRVVRLLVLW